MSAQCSVQTESKTYISNCLFDSFTWILPGVGFRVRHEGILRCQQWGGSRAPPRVGGEPLRGPHPQGPERPPQGSQKEGGWGDVPAGRAGPGGGLWQRGVEISRRCWTEAWLSSGDEAGGQGLGAAPAPLASGSLLAIFGVPWLVEASPQSLSLSSHRVLPVCGFVHVPRLLPGTLGNLPGCL